MPSGYAAAVEAAGNYPSGDDYVVEFLGYRFSFNASTSSSGSSPPPSKLGLVYAHELDEDETADLVELAARRDRGRRAARSASTSSATGSARPRRAASRSSTG